MPPISAPLPEPPTARPINAPAAAPPATAPTFRPRVEPATMLSAVALMLCDLPFASIEVTRSTSTARSPFSAGFTPSTTPCTTLPAGNGAMLPTTTASEIEPDHSWPMLAVSEESGEFIVILSPVPAVTVAVGAAGGAGGVRFGLGCSVFGAGVGEGVGVCSWVTGAGCGGMFVCGWICPCGCSTGLEASRLSVLAAEAGVFWAAFWPQPASMTSARVAREYVEVRRRVMGFLHADPASVPGLGANEAGSSCVIRESCGRGSHRMPAGRGRRKRRARSAGPGACARRSLAESFARAVKIVRGATRRPKLLRRHRRAAGPLRPGGGRAGSASKPSAATNLLEDRDHETLGTGAERRRGAVRSLPDERHRRIQHVTACHRGVPLGEREPQDRRPGRESRERRPDDLEHVAGRILSNDDARLEREPGEEQRPERERGARGRDRGARAGADQIARPRDVAHRGEVDRSAAPGRVDRTVRSVPADLDAQATGAELRDRGGHVDHGGGLSGHRDEGRNDHRRWRRRHHGCGGHRERRRADRAAERRGDRGARGGGDGAGRRGERGAPRPRRGGGGRPARGGGRGARGGGGGAWAVAGTGPPPAPPGTVPRAGTRATVVRLLASFTT